MNKTRKIGLFFGGKSVEHEVSLRSMKSIVNALEKNKFDPVLFPVSKSGKIYTCSDMQLFENAQSVDDVLDQLSFVGIDGILSFNLSCVFSTMHGGHGENGAYQGLFEILEIPYVGPGVLGSAVAMDKDVAKRLLENANIPVVPFTTFRKSDFELEKLPDLGYPCFVKAASLGSSVGVYKCKNKEEVLEAVRSVFELDSKVIIEKAMQAREIEVAVLGSDSMKASLAGEVIPHHDFYSYEAKYLDANGASLDYPAKGINHDVFKDQAIKACKILEIQGMARVDFFVEASGAFFINEINTLPGFTNISMYPKLFETSGISYQELISELIEDAILRFAKNSSLQKTLYANLVDSKL
jgi:D-alanine-D-alanine ligase